MGNTMPIISSLFFKMICFAINCNLAMGKNILALSHYRALRFKEKNGHDPVPLTSNY